MPRAVLYCRVSTDEQAESRNGLDAQVEAGRAWAERNGLDLVGPYVETEGVSGATPIERRVTLLEAMAEVGKGDVLLAAKRDRIGRDPILMASVEALLKRKGGRLVSAAGEGTDGDDAASVLMRRMVDAFAEYERLMIKGRTRAALAAKKRRGERTGRVPYGQRVHDDGRRSRRGNLPIALVPDEAEALVLARIFELRARGWACGRIAWALNAAEVPSRSGSPWQASTIHHLCTAHGVMKGPSHVLTPTLAAPLGSAPALPV